ncbi:TrmH family RNA methyltransferase [Pararobbsia silviterrae]|uniref:RNA methyltransferase n=1 Tax=Pararobbsia silviterrae TaxID=1792498 RepID=A0A494Y2I7_9BURK|nr:RNA methyltransferase [Pararobbsia silviterrae]RKP54667.1 RNA methyltransferase [Pararobbsia silviterrae]
MKVVTSRDNALVKRLHAMAASTSQQRRADHVLAEGIHLATAFLDAGGVPHQCVISESALDDVEAQAVLRRIDDHRVTMLPDALFRQVSTVVQGVGLLLLLDRATPVLPDAIERDCVVLDGLQDAGNVGSILRSAAAAGVRDVFCVSGTAYAWSSKVLRSGMGAHWHLDIHEHVEPADVLSRLRVPLALTDSHGAQPIDRIDLGGPVAWVFGNEGAGVSAAWRDAPHLRVTIPQPGGMESLNVAAAAAICLFEQGRQRRAHQG